MVTGVLDSIIMFRFDKTKVEKTEFNIAKQKKKQQQQKCGMLMLIKLIETKCSFKYMIDYLDDVIRPLVLVLPKLKGHVKNFKAENNMLMSFCIGEY